MRRSLLGASQYFSSSCQIPARLLWEKVVTGDERELRCEIGRRRERTCQVAIRREAFAEC